MLSTPTELYSDRAVDYLHGRPDYPGAALDQLRRPGAMSGAATIADVGAGTGILTGMLLARGYRVIAVEPNRAMRRLCDHRFDRHSGYRSTATTAERTGLPDSSVDAVTVGQALHWFELGQARIEFERILRPGGLLLFLWNTLDVAEDPIAHAVDSTLSARLPAYAVNKAAEPDPVELARNAVPPGTILHIAQFAHQQLLHADAFRSRFLSASYAPSSCDPLTHVLMKELAAVFQAYQERGAVTLHYRTTAIVGAWTPGAPRD